MQSNTNTSMMQVVKVEYGERDVKTKGVVRKTRRCDGWIDSRMAWQRTKAVMSDGWTVTMRTKSVITVFACVVSLVALVA